MAFLFDLLCSFLVSYVELHGSCFPLRFVWKASRFHVTSVIVDEFDTQ